MEIKKITLIGCGAVGAIVAQPLSEYLGKENFQILADGERLQRYKKDGLWINGTKQDFNFVSPDQAQPSDLIIIATKNLQLKDAMQMMKKACGPQTKIMSLLNGIQSERDLSECFDQKNILYSFVLSLNSIHVGKNIDCSNNGTVIFGEKDNSKSETVLALIDLFTKAKVNYLNPENIHLEIWKKFLINVTFNTLSALCRSPYGGFNYDVMKDLARQTGSEVIAVANAEGIPLTMDHLEHDIKMMCGHDPHGKTSMLQDMEAGRLSENAWFCGTIVKLAAEHNIPVPVCTLLEKLVDGTEKVRNV